MNPKTVGWLFVAVQAALIAVLVLLPGGDAWPTPGWLRLAANVLTVLGLALAAVAALGLGAALTPTPEPTARGQLKTAGLFRLVRHPIYTGVLAVIVAMVLRSGSVLTALIGIAGIGFFHVKARWEEARLAVAYPEYNEYKSTTPRFMPSPRKLLANRALRTATGSEEPR